MDVVTDIYNCPFCGTECAVGTQDCIPTVYQSQVKCCSCGYASKIVTWKRKGRLLLEMNTHEDEAVRIHNDLCRRINHVSA